MKISKRKIEASNLRYDKAQDAYSSFTSEITRGLSKNKIQAEYDSWAWYYAEMSAIRNECSRIGLIVRMENDESYGYIKMYHGHIMTFLNLVSPVIPERIWDKILIRWNEIYHKVDTALIQYKTIGKSKDFKLLIDEIDNLFRLGLRVAQIVGLGFKTSLSDVEGSHIAKTFLGE